MKYFYRDIIGVIRAIPSVFLYSLFTYFHVMLTQICMAYMNQISLTLSKAKKYKSCEITKSYRMINGTY